MSHEWFAVSCNVRMQLVFLDTIQVTKKKQEFLGETLLCKKQICTKKMYISMRVRMYKKSIEKE